MATRTHFGAFLLVAASACAGSGCGSEDDEGPANYPCLVSALVLTGFTGSCDTRSTATAPGECRAFYGTTPAAATAACQSVGGTFDATERCASTSRILRCAIDDNGSTIVHSYYTPTYSEASAAELCGSRGGRCVRGSGGE